MYKPKLPDKREELILPYIKNKEVLDLGCADIRERFLHSFVVRNSKRTVGIELYPERAKLLKKMGYEVVVADAQNFNLNKKFDVVLAGDIIEHLTNFDGFLKSIKKHLKPNGLLLISTPNAFSLYARLGLKKAFEEHTCWFCERTLTRLLNMYGFKVINIIYYTNDYGTIKGKIAHTLFKLFPKLNSEMFFVCKLK